MYRTLFTLGLAGLATAHPKASSPETVIEKDVVIIGGGATGTYAAIRLREDLGQSVLVVEKNGYLGGHAETFFEPNTGFPINYGVQAYLNDENTVNFWGRFGVEFQTVTAPALNTSYVDFKTGKPVVGYPSADPAPALAKYGGLITSEPYIYLQNPSGSYEVFNEAITTTEAAAPFTQTFADFVKANGLEAGVPVFWQFLYSLGDLANAPVFDVEHIFGVQQLVALERNGFVLPESYAVSELYSRALALLGTDVSLNTTVKEINRSKKGHTIVIKTPTGKQTIKAKKLLITIPPTIDNLDPLDITKAERAVFKKWTWQNLYVGVISSTGLADGTVLQNTSPTDTLNLPKLPFVQQFAPSGIPGYFRFVVVGDKDFSASDAKKLIKKNLRKLGGKEPVYNAFASHTPNTLRVGPDGIANGFYKSLYNLQGQKNTWWLGAAWSTDYSSILWTFAEGLLPAIAA